MIAVELDNMNTLLFYEPQSMLAPHMPAFPQKQKLTATWNGS